MKKISFRDETHDQHEVVLEAATHIQKEKNDHVNYWLENGVVKYMVIMNGKGKTKN